MSPPLKVEVMHEGAPEASPHPRNLESRHMTLTMSVQLKTQQNKTHQ